MGKKRSPWGVWWLSVITLGVYYLVWYVKINKELRRASGDLFKVGTFGLWMSQCIPIANWISLANTANRLNMTQQKLGESVSGSPGMTILSSFWFSSQTRYLQRRLNTTWVAGQIGTHSIFPALSVHPAATESTQAFSGSPTATQIAATPAVLPPTNNTSAVPELAASAISVQTTPNAPAGWYPDSAAPGFQRYWDGAIWTEHTAPLHP